MEEITPKRAQRYISISDSIKTFKPKNIDKKIYKFFDENYTNGVKNFSYEAICINYQGIITQGYYRLKAIAQSGITDCIPV